MPGGPVSSQPCASLPEASARPSTASAASWPCSSGLSAGARMLARHGRCAARRDRRRSGAPPERGCRRRPRPPARVASTTTQRSGSARASAQEARAHPLMERAAHPLVALPADRRLAAAEPVATGTSRITRQVRTKVAQHDRVQAIDRAPRRRAPATPWYTRVESMKRSHSTQRPAAKAGAIRRTTWS